MAEQTTFGKQAETVREALETLCNEASYADTSDSAQGIDLNNEIEREALAALRQIVERAEASEAFLRRMAEDAEQTLAGLPQHSGNGQSAALAALGERLAALAREALDGIPS